MNLNQIFDLKCKVLDEELIPQYATEDSAGADLFCNELVVLKPGDKKLVGTGIAVEIPVGFFGMLLPRSGTGKLDVMLANTVGIIDSDYRGEIKLFLKNNNTDDIVTISKMDQVCQLIVLPFLPCRFLPTNKLSETIRGDNGFGSNVGKGGK